MLPYYYRYNHTNYARWSTVYLTEMHQLPQEVANEFQKDNFVVKDTNKLFNQVSPDHSQKRLNNFGKAGGRIVGITKKHDDFEQVGFVEQPKVYYFFSNQGNVSPRSFR